MNQIVSLLFSYKDYLALYNPKSFIWHQRNQINQQMMKSHKKKSSVVSLPNGYTNLHVLFYIKTIHVAKQQGYYLLHSLSTKWVHTFPKSECICATGVRICLLRCRNTSQ